MLIFTSHFSGPAGAVGRMSVCSDNNFWTECRLTEMSGTLAHHDTNQVKFKGQRDRLKFMVTGWEILLK